MHLHDLHSYVQSYIINNINRLQTTDIDHRKHKGQLLKTYQYYHDNLSVRIKSAQAFQCAAVVSSLSLVNSCTSNVLCCIAFYVLSTFSQLHNCRQYNEASTHNNAVKLFFCSVNIDLTYNNLLCNETSTMKQLLKTEGLVGD